MLSSYVIIRLTHVGKLLDDKVLALPIPVAREHILVLSTAVAHEVVAMVNALGLGEFAVNFSKEPLFFLHRKLWRLLVCVCVCVCVFL